MLENGETFSHSINSHEMVGATPLTVGLSKLNVQDWGLIDYAEALDRQFHLVEAVQEDPSNETLVICRHPPVVTLGRSTEPQDIFGWKGVTYEIQRGGRATYHGPSQLVAYPILDLDRRGRDLRKYLRNLEAGLIEMLKEFGIDARAEEGATGVWTGARKVASIGIGVKRWVSYHGIALNVSHDPEAFVGINPCGFSPETMISMESLLGSPVSFEKVSEALVAKYRSLLAVEDRPSLVWSPA